MEIFFDSDLYQWILLPLSIFLAKATSETIGTLRVMFSSKGNSIMAPLFGFFEVLIWIVIIGQVMQNLDNVLCYIAYAGGFALGNFLGIKIEEKLAQGVMMIHVSTRKDTTDLQKSLRENEYGFTQIKGDDIDGVENMLFIIVKRKEIKNVIKIIKEFNPNAFFSINEVNKINEGSYPLKESKKVKKNGGEFMRKIFSRNIVAEEQGA